MAFKPFEFICVWCGHKLYEEPPKVCKIPHGDGHLYSDGHLYERKEIKDIYESTHNDVELSITTYFGTWKA